MSRRRTFLGAVGVGLTAGLAGCSSGRDTLTPALADGDSPRSALSGAPETFVYTHLRPSRNRRVDLEGSGVPRSVSDPTDVAVDGTPVWVVARPVSSGAEWVVVSGDGTVTGVRVTPDGSESFEPSTPSLPPRAPPLLRREGSPELVEPPSGSARVTHPLPVEGGFVSVTNDGRVVLVRGGETTTVTTDVLPDARIVAVDARHAAVLTDTTTSYAHGALGDTTEARRLAVFDTGTGVVVREHEAASDRVFEAIAPVAASFADLDPALVVTETDARVGARLVAFGPGGERIAGPPVGRGFRWRHPLCVAPFAPDGEDELAVVKTPHIGGTVEFYRRVGGELEIAATFDDASSHANGSRNLDGAFAADVDGDGRPELVVPNDARAELQVLSRTDKGVEPRGALPVADRITSNVHAVGTPGGLQVGVARDGALRVWRYI